MSNNSNESIPINPVMREGKNGGKLKSGNTKNAGRKPRIPSIEEALEKALLETDESEKTVIDRIIKTLIDKALDGELKAIDSVLDRVYGKSKERVDFALLDIPDRLTLTGKQIQFISAWKEDGYTDEEINAMLLELE
jgi:hypothetical protein